MPPKRNVHRPELFWFWIEISSAWWFGCHFLFSQKYWEFLIIPIDELIFFRGVALAHQPVILTPLKRSLFWPGIARVVLLDWNPEAVEPKNCFDQSTSTCELADWDSYKNYGNHGQGLEFDDVHVIFISQSFWLKKSSQALQRTWPLHRGPCVLLLEEIPSLPVPQNLGKISCEIAGLCLVSLVSLFFKNPLKKVSFNTKVAEDPQNSTHIHDYTCIYPYHIIWNCLQQGFQLDRWRFHIMVIMVVLPKLP